MSNQRVVVLTGEQVRGILSLVEMSMARFRCLDPACNICVSTFDSIVRSNGKLD